MTGSDAPLARAESRQSTGGSGASDGSGDGSDHDGPDAFSRASAGPGLDLRNGMHIAAWVRLDGPAVARSEQVTLGGVGAGRR